MEPTDVKTIVGLADYLDQVMQQLEDYEVEDVSRAITPLEDEKYEALDAFFADEANDDWVVENLSSMSEFDKGLVQTHLADLQDRVDQACIDGYFDVWPTLYSMMGVDAPSSLEWDEDDPCLPTTTDCPQSYVCRFLKVGMGGAPGPIGPTWGACKPFGDNPPDHQCQCVPVPLPLWLMALIILFLVWFGPVTVRLIMQALQRWRARIDLEGAIA